MAVKLDEISVLRRSRLSNAEERCGSMATASIPELIEDAWRASTPIERDTQRFFPRYRVPVSKYP